MATIKDVAARAEVSITLVSRYLNGVKGVGNASAARIQAAIDELGYRPNELARSLVLQKTNTIGVVVDTLSSTFMFPLFEGLESGALEFNPDNRYNIIYCSANGREEQKRRHIRFLTQGRVDGLLIYGSCVEDDRLIASLAESRFPFALIENDPPGIDVNKIVIDNAGGAREAVQWLVRKGCRRIFHMSGNDALKITCDRRFGYCAAMEEAGLEPVVIWPEGFRQTQKEVVLTKQRLFEAGYQEMKKLLEAGDLPDGIFFASDVLAFGAVQALNEAGKSVPEDLQVVGFDDENPWEFNSRLSRIPTLRQPLHQAGYLGMKSLIQSLAHPQDPKTRIVLKTELIEPLLP